MELKDQIVEALKEVYDPELGINVVDLGLIYDVDVDAEQNVHVTMTLTTPGCPLHDSIVFGMKDRVQEVPAVAAVDVDVVWEPAWTPEKMSKDAMEQLGF
ncbi:metal-sulfur cluster assembly factor [Bacillus piscicola]|uniref:metal-sulfur cluster assembly factor n=1 Tax=Bacillus piscicola TaxID=1632684 RepID=UPI001F0924B7|nr:metal-sulfur cluster assembly factor [Bacillus piscicola]